MAGRSRFTAQTIGQETKQRTRGAQTRDMGGLSWIFPLGKEGNEERQETSRREKSLQLGDVHGLAFQGWGAGWGGGDLDSEEETV